MKLTGTAWKYGDNVDTDVIIPARYLNVSDPQELAEHCMEDIDQAFATNIQAGDMIVAGANFGSGSSREHAPIAIKASGVSCVIAENYARIFYRNAFNIGLPILECPEAVAAVRRGDRLEVELERGVIRNLTTDETFHAQPIPDFMLEIIRAGGLVPYTRERLSGNSKQ